MENLYKQAYDERTLHTTNIKAVLDRMVGAICDIVVAAANAGLTDVDSRILIDINRQAMREVNQEQIRFEEAMRRILNLEKSE